MEDGDDGRNVPLLGKKRHVSLLPLYTVTFFQALAFTVAKMPALSLRFQEFAAAEGWEASSVASAFGRMSAARSLLEFFATPVLATWSDRVGRKRIMCISCLALCLECVLLSCSHSLLGLSLAHVAFGLFSDSNGTLEGSCIADATPPGDARVIAFGKLFSVVGAAIVLGPAVGGELAAHGGLCPLFVGCALAWASLAFMVVELPEYLPEKERRQRGAQGGNSSTTMIRDFVRLLASAPGLPWYIAASALGQVAIGAFGSVQALWARESLGWDGRDLARFISLVGLTMVVSQRIVLKKLLEAMRGREPALAQLCLLVQAGRLAAYGLAPRGAWVYVASLVTMAGSCHNPVLRSLCSRAAGQAQQGLLSGGTSAVGTAAQVLGSLVGSSIFAACLRHGMPLNMSILLCSACFALASVCVARGKDAETRHKVAKDAEAGTQAAMGG